MTQVQVVGAGLAGCEVALQLARRGLSVKLIEMKPKNASPASSCGLFGELVCSNSLRSANPENAIGELKREMAFAGSAVMEAAYATAVPAGDALAVDRERFAQWLTDAVHAESNIECCESVVEAIPEGLTVICTGPLTEGPLAQAIADRASALQSTQQNLYFYDAIAPIIQSDSIDWQVVFRQSRYDKGDGADYANIPLTYEEYSAFVEAVNEGEKVTPHGFEDARYFEGCLPIEVMASRGFDTLSHGPMKPVGLIDPRTGRRPYAVVQLRMENREATAWNMVGFQTRLKYPEQKRIFRMLPGLQNAEFLRFGSVHRNTYIHAPSLLTPDLHWRDDPSLYFAGQITGVEGYVESAACGLLVAWYVWAAVNQKTIDPPPPTTAFGALKRHLSGDGLNCAYCPSNVNWSLFAPLDTVQKLPKSVKKMRYAERAWRDFQGWWSSFA